MKTIELANNLIALSNLAPVSNRSWLPVGSRGLEPFNVYLVLCDERALLVDTGPPAHREAILTKLRETIGSRELSIMVTRSELECIGNIGAIVDSLNVRQVLGTMKNLPILGLTHFSKPIPSTLSADRIVTGKSLEAFGFPRLRPLEPVIKTLSTIWMHDELENVLFTSDFFGADLMPTKNSDVVRRDREDMPSREFIRKRLHAKFDWMERADLSSISTAWSRFFRELRPNVIAPGLGRILSGEAVALQSIEDYRVALFGAP